MFDFLFRRGNPTNKWQQPPGFMLRTDLLRATVNDTKIGLSVQSYSFLGRSAAAENMMLQYYKLGFVLEYEDDIVSGYQLVFHDLLNEFHRYTGQILIDGASVNVDEIMSRLGEPYCSFKDEDEILTYYEYPGHEIEIEQTLDGQVKLILVNKEPMMAEDGYRKECGVTKPWPPY